MSGDGGEAEGVAGEADETRMRGLVSGWNQWPCSRLRREEQGGFGKEVLDIIELRAGTEATLFQPGQSRVV